MNSAIRIVHEDLAFDPLSVKFMKREFEGRVGGMDKFVWTFIFESGAIVQVYNDDEGKSMRQLVTGRRHKESKG